MSQKQAVGRFVLIEKDKATTQKRRSGLETPTGTEDRFIKGKILSVSENIGEKEFGLKEGQEILFDKHAGQPLKIDGNPYHMITCNDVAIIL